MPGKEMSVDDLLDNVGALPPMPLVARRATEIIKDVKSSMNDLANVVKLDPSMSSIILRWVNSAYYALRQPVISIEQAIVFLGQRTVQNLVLSASVASFMSRPLPGYALQKGDLWKHAVGTSAGARLIMQGINPRQAEDAYYAGLFCDIGKLAFDVLIQKGILKQGFPIDPASRKLPFQDTETRLFGYDHTIVSAAMAERWKLPEYIVEVIRYHHTPSKVSEAYRTIAYAVHTADATMMMLGIGVGVDGLQYPLDPNVIQILKWKEDSFEKLYERVMPLILEVEDFLKV
jgi:HD-like signal output (HDOD) protein